MAGSMGRICKVNCLLDRLEPRFQVELGVAGVGNNWRNA